MPTGIRAAQTPDDTQGVDLMKDKIRRIMAILLAFAIVAGSILSALPLFGN